MLNKKKKRIFKVAPARESSLLIVAIGNNNACLEINPTIYLNNVPCFIRNTREKWSGVGAFASMESGKASQYMAQQRPVLKIRGLFSTPQTVSPLESLIV